MNKIEEGIIISFLTISVVALFIPVAIYIIRKINQNSNKTVSRYSTVSRVLIFSSCFILSVWCIRYAVGYYSIITADKSTGSLTWFEEIFNSMVHTFQTFSMDESYTDYIINGKLMLTNIFGADSVFIGIYGVYASLLNFIAPIVGGAIIFDILASIFPKLRLWFSYFAFYREKYYFCKLNEASLALAESICKTSFSSFKKPIIVFTDAYIDDNDEKGSEMLLKAKALGAICIIDDINHVRKNKFGTRRFFLTDEDCESNLNSLCDLTDEFNYKYLKNAEIYIFTDDNIYVDVETRIHNKLVEDLKFKEDELPVLVPIDNYNNLVNNLLVNIPLYEPIIDKPKETDGTRTLTLSIIGAGQIGIKMFLSSYWIGQMLDCNLKINMISRESEDEFKDKLNTVNPEILHTTISNDNILKINRKGDIANVYCELNYFQCDTDSTEFIQYLTDESKLILDTDYYFIAQGSDIQNISCANTVRKYVGEHHINSNDNLKTVISYVVFDTKLSDTLNRKRFYCIKDETTDIYMQAVGNLRDVNSIGNIFLPQYNPFAEKTCETFGTIQNRESRADIQKSRLNDLYNYIDGISKLFHLKYKIFSMGMFHTSLFNCNNSDRIYFEEFTKACTEYKNTVTGKFHFETAEDEAKYLTLMHRMSWLEHRRWNAFMRTQGFTQPKDYNNYAKPGIIGSYRNTNIKLHPCLVECDQNGIKAKVSSYGIIDKSTVLCSKSKDDFDLLDDLSYEMYDKKINDYDFKQFDYPINTVI